MVELNTDSFHNFGKKKRVLERFATKGFSSGLSKHDNHFAAWKEGNSHFGIHSPFLSVTSIRMKGFPWVPFFYCPDYWLQGKPARVSGFYSNHVFLTLEATIRKRFQRLKFGDIRPGKPRSFLPRA